METSLYIDSAVGGQAQSVTQSTLPKGLRRAASEAKLPTVTAPSRDVSNLRRGKRQAAELRQLFATLGLQVKTPPLIQPRGIPLSLTSHLPASHRKEFHQQLEPIIEGMDKASAHPSRAPSTPHYC